MDRSRSVRNVLLATGVVLLVAGCGGHKSSSTAAASTAPSAVARTTAAAPSTTRAHTAAPASAVTAAGGKTCSATQVVGTINGVPKCLQAGELCQSKAVAQYPAYGFDCTLTAGRWTLHKRA